jgi:hypothetical protein
MSTKAIETDKRQAGEQLPDARYEAVGAIEAHRGADIATPWLRMQYPLESRGAATDGQMRTTTNFAAIQHDDGSGLFQSPAGTALYAIRTAAGTVIGNSSRRTVWPWGTDPAAEPLVEQVTTIPFLFVGQLATERTTLDTTEKGTVLVLDAKDETSVEGNAFMRGVVEADVLEETHDETGVLLSHESGVQLYVGRDSTAHAGIDDDLFGFVPFDGTDGTPVPSAADALDLLMPHQAATTETYRRQGEWFLLPADESPNGTIQKPGVGTRPYGGSPLESHVPRDWATGVPDSEYVERMSATIEGLPGAIETPQAVFEWLHDTEADEQLFKQARALAEGIYVRGTLRHRHNEHYVEHVEDWHYAVTHEYDVMTLDGQQLIVD